jgi:uncharacterized membrane protein
MALTTIGIIHTVISLMAVASGAIALIRNKKITWTTNLGKIFVITTIITCLSGFGIYQHGGFGKAHVLGIITLLVQTLALVAGKNSRPFGKVSLYIETLAYSFTFFLHLIPGITETMTRLPLDAPFATSPEDSNIQLMIGICFVLFVIGVVLQVLKLKRKGA